MDLKTIWVTTSQICSTPLDLFLAIPFTCSNPNTHYPLPTTTTFITGAIPSLILIPHNKGSPKPNPYPHISLFHYTTIRQQCPKLFSFSSFAFFCQSFRHCRSQTQLRSIRSTQTLNQFRTTGTMIIWPSLLLRFNFKIIYYE